MKCAGDDVTSGSNISWIVSLPCVASVELAYLGAGAVTDVGVGHAVVDVAGGSRRRSE